MTSRFVFFAALESGMAKAVRRDDVRVVEDTEAGVSVTLADGTMFMARGRAAEVLAQLEKP